VRRRTVAVKRRPIHVPAVRTRALVTGNGPFRRQCSSAAAGTRMAWIGNLVEVAARSADQDIRCVPGILRQHVARKQVEAFPARRARPRLHPQELLDVGILPAGHGAPRL
jgi:hypothetical protein